MSEEPSDVTSADVSARYPFIMDYTDDVLAPLLLLTIDESEDDVSEAQLGTDLRERAIIALSAHKMLVQIRSQDGDNGPGQMLSAFGAGGVSATYVTPPPEGISQTSHHFYTTQPGVDYMELCQRMGTGVRIV